MPSKLQKKSKKNKERYRQRTSTPVPPDRSLPKSPLQGSEKGNTPDLRSPSSALASMQIGTPRPRKESTSSEAPPIKRGRENSEQSEFSTPNPRGRPKMPARGRPKAATEHPESASQPKQIRQEQPQAQEIEFDNATKVRQEQPQSHEIDFENVQIEFAITRNSNATIWRAAALPLYQRDGQAIPELGPRFIETLWNNPGEWLNDAMIHAFLCYIAKQSARHTAVVDSIIFDPRNVIERNALGYCFNYDANADTEVVLMPLHFGNHWALLIHDVEFGTVFIDSLPGVPDRFTIGHHDYNDQMEAKVKLVLAEIYKSNADDFYIQVLDAANHSRQPDGNSCGYYVCWNAEAWLFNDRNLNLDSINLTWEKRRVLWHINQLYGTDDVSYHPINFTRNPPVQAENQQVTQLISNAVIQHQFDQIENDHDEGLNLEPEPMEFEESEPRIETPRWNLRKRKAKSLLINVQVPKKIVPQKDTTVLPVQHKCKLRHKETNCASMAAGHFPDYYDSGDIGHYACYQCQNRLLPNEKCWSCTNGRVELPPLKQYPSDYEMIVSGKSHHSGDFFRNESRLNSTFAFASISVGHGESHSGGPMPVLLNGEFHRRISSMLAGDRQVPSFGQLYILNSKDATEYRLANNSFADWVKKDPFLFFLIDKMIREYHPMASILQNAYEYYQELEQTNPEQVQNFRIILVRDNQVPEDLLDERLHMRQVNLPTQDEATVFALWTSATDEPPPIKGIWVAKKGHLTELWTNHPMTDSLLYPCLFLCGDEGYDKNIPYKKPAKGRTDTRHSKTIVDDSVSVECDDENFDEESVAGIAEDTEERYGDEPGTSRSSLSIRAFYLYRLGIRYPENEKYHHIWSAGGGLGQKFLLDIAARIDSQVFDQYRQPHMRIERPEHIIEYLKKQGNLPPNVNIGKVVLFRKCMPGFRAYFKKKFADACTIINRTRVRGKATFFLTFTSNPRWPEIKKQLYRINDEEKPQEKKPQQQLVDRPDILVRYFADKAKELYVDLSKRQIFGCLRGYAQSMEFQKKGGPHIHRVMATDIDANPNIIKDYIWAHIPALPEDDDKSEKANGIRRLRELVIQHQLHDCREDLCGPNKNGKCKKFFPKDFSDRTILHEDRPAIYYRPSPEMGGEMVDVKKGKSTITYTNAHVVPYSPFILLKYQTHHNVEFAYGEKTNMKYTMKYPFKGASVSYIRVDENTYDIDEPAYFAKMYYRSACEAFCRLISLPYALLSHVIYDLPLHLPKQQNVCFDPRKAHEAFEKVQAGDLKETMLSSYWSQWVEGKSLQGKSTELIKDDEIKSMLYEKMPEKYTWNQGQQLWKKRIYKKNDKVIGSIYKPQPKNQELFALYVLIRHFPGDPETLKTFNGRVYDTFTESARLHGLLSDNSVWERTLEEFSHFKMPNEMRRLFVQVLIFGNPSNARELWDKFVDHMFKPVIGNDPQDRERKRRINRALAQIEAQLMDHQMRNADFFLPEPDGFVVPVHKDTDKALDRFFFGDDDLNDDDGSSTTATQQGLIILNQDQKKVAKTIMQAVNADPTNMQIPRCFFIVGDGGTGKTELFKWLRDELRKQKKRSIACAYTGCAAILIPGGATAHSIFQFRLDIDSDSTPCIRIQSYHGRRIAESDVIFLDEASMVPKHMLEGIDRVCRQLAPSEQLKNLPFGGKVVVLSGDFKQSLPVVKRGSPIDQVDACIQSSPLWRNLFSNNILYLTINMRQGPGEREFSEWARKIGDGTLGSPVLIPKENLVTSQEELINFVTDNGKSLKNPAELIKGLILAPHNVKVDAINEKILAMLPTPIRTFLSTDESNEERPLDYNEAETYVDALNQLNPPALPPHELKLKEGAIIMLIRNINPGRGLVNGTRMIVRTLGLETIRAEIITGSGAGSGRYEFLARIWSDYEDQHAQIKFRRFQFPVRLAFAMTIMKAQGQTVTRMGLDLEHEVFGPGNLYTAISRVRSGRMFRVYAPESPEDAQTKGKYVQNVVAQGINYLTPPQ